MAARREEPWPYTKVSCIEWQGARDKDGYGRGESTSSAGSRAHRVLYELFYNVTLTPTDVLLHTCDNPSCVNPQHMTRGSQLENVRDMDSKGRRVNASSNVTHCPYGHEYTKENTVLWRDGKRRCKTCETNRRKR
jgi:hypothetical protein